MILVTGATGNIGKELIPLLLQTGQLVRVLTRDEHKVAHLDARVERAVGDLDKPETLRMAVKGVERLFLVTFETQQDINMIETAKEQVFDRSLSCPRWRQLSTKSRLGNGTMNAKS